MNIAPPGAVEVAGEHVHDVDEPARERAELLRARADAAVHRGALGAAASSRATRRMVSASMPHTGATSSGAKSRASRSTSSSPFDVAGDVAEVDELVRRTSVCTIAKRKCASVPGRMKRCSSASSAVFERRGIDDDELAAAGPQRPQPPGKSGAVIRLPFDANGFAPRMSR